MTKPVADKLNPGHRAAVRRMLAHDALGHPAGQDDTAEQPPQQQERSSDFRRPAIGDRIGPSPSQQAARR
jgi:hypothetical protein